MIICACEWLLFTHTHELSLTVSILAPEQENHFSRKFCISEQMVHCKYITKQFPKLSIDSVGFTIDAIYKFQMILLIFSTQSYCIFQAVDTFLDSTGIMSIVQNYFILICFLIPKAIFQLILSQLKILENPESALFKRAYYLLEVSSLHKTKL